MASRDSHQRFASPVRKIGRRLLQHDQVSYHKRVLPMRRWKHFAYALAFLAIIGFERAEAQTENITVIVTGSGTSIDEAKTDAIRQALQRTMKQLVVVDRAIEGNQLLRDKVMSTMNGYIERFQEREIKRDGTNFTLTAEISVSASRIENFIGIITGVSGPIEGSRLLAERNQRIAQAEAQARTEVLQKQARGEIFDRLFRGFPSDDIEVQTQSVRLSPADPNIVQIEIRYQYKAGFVSALEATLKALALFECKGVNFSTAFAYEVRLVFSSNNMDHFANPSCPDALGKLPIGSEVDAICVRLPTTVTKCYGLYPGNYCRSCRIDLFSSYKKGVLILGKFTDAVGRDANARTRCLFAIARREVTPSEAASSTAYAEMFTETFFQWSGWPPNVFTREARTMAAGIDLRRQHAVIEFPASEIDLNRTESFVGIAALTAWWPVNWSSIQERSRRP